MCKILLDNFANREITDHMDRLPRDIASERRHSDIVRLLDEHVPHSPQMLGGLPHNSSSSLIGKCSISGYDFVVGFVDLISMSVYRITSSFDEPFDASWIDEDNEQE